jgi:hypothetical protein
VVRVAPVAGGEPAKEAAMMVQERDGQVRQVRRRGRVRRIAQLLAGLLPRRVAVETQRQ